MFIKGKYLAVGKLIQMFFLQGIFVGWDSNLGVGVMGKKRIGNDSFSHEKRH
jgi:hypothetical protein